MTTSNNKLARFASLKTEAEVTVMNGFSVTRSATISKAMQLGVSQDMVRLHARLSFEDIFKKNYLKIRTGGLTTVQNPDSARPPP